jgi:hypothetical protein
MRDPRLWRHGRLWAYALMITVLFFVSHLAGFQAHTSVLAGAHSGGYGPQVCGLVYLMLYVLFVCIVPIMVIADSILWLGGRWTKSL